MKFSKIISIDEAIETQKNKLFEAEKEKDKEILFLDERISKTKDGFEELFYFKAKIERIKAFREEQEIMLKLLEAQRNGVKEVFIEI